MRGACFSPRSVRYHRSLMACVVSGANEPAAARGRAKSRPFSPGYGDAMMLSNPRWITSIFSYFGTVCISGLLARAFVFAYWLNDIHIWILLNRRRSWLLIVLLSQSAVALIVTFAVMALLQVVNLILPPCVGWLICFVSFDCLEPNSRAIACLAAVQLLAINSSSFACLTVKK